MEERRERVKREISNLLKNKTTTKLSNNQVKLNAEPLNLNYNALKGYSIQTEYINRTDKAFEDKMKEFYYENLSFEDEYYLRLLCRWMVDQHYNKTPFAWLVNKVLKTRIRRREGSGTIDMQIKGLYAEGIIQKCFEDLFNSESNNPDGFDGGVDLILDGKAYDIKCINRNIDWHLGYSQVNYSKQQVLNENRTDYLILASYNQRNGGLMIVNIIPYPEDFETDENWVKVKNPVNGANKTLKGEWYMLKDDTKYLKEAI